MNNGHSLLTVLEVANSKVKVPAADLVSGEGFIPGSQTVIFLLYLHMIKREKANFLMSFYKGTNNNEHSILIT